MGNAELTDGAALPPRHGPARARGGSGRTGRLLVLALVLVAAAPSPLPSAPFFLPPLEAFEEHPTYDRWAIVGTEIGRGGETAQITLRHPTNDRVVARLTYRLLDARISEAVR